jgi:hypothetical protein
VAAIQLKALLQKAGPIATEAIQADFDWRCYGGREKIGVPSH